MDVVAHQQKTPALGGLFQAGGVNPNPCNGQYHIYVQVHHGAVKPVIVLLRLLGIHNQASHQNEQKCQNLARKTIPYFS